MATAWTNVWSDGDTHPLVVRLATYIAVVLSRTPDVAVVFDQKIRRVSFVNSNAKCILTLTPDGTRFRPAVYSSYGIPNCGEFGMTYKPSTAPGIIAKIVSHLQRG